MKKVISLVIVSVLFALSLCACSDKGKNNSSTIDVQSEVTSNVVSDTQSDDTVLKPQVNNTSKPTVSSKPQNSSNTSSKKPPIVDMENLSATVIEKFTDVQLEWVHKNAEKFPENFVFANLNDCAKVIESAKTKDEAIANAKEKYSTPVYDVTECKILSETDNFYVVYVKWVSKKDPNNGKFREEKAVCFKENVFDVDDSTSEGEISSKDKGLIKNIFDYVYYCKYNNLGGYKVLYSEVTEEKASLKYTVYFVGTVYGDKGIMDEVSLYKQEIIIEKDDREFESKAKVTLKKIGVIGEGYDGEGGFIGEE